MTQGLLKQWFSKYGKPAAAPQSAAEVRIASRQELEAKYGHLLPTLADEYVSDAIQALRRAAEAVSSGMGNGRCREGVVQV